MNTIVMKFGGTSVASNQKLKNIAEIVNKEAKNDKIIVVLSAMAGETNKLQSYLDEFESKNSIESDLSGVIGLIPSYDILDLSLSFSMNNTMIELGVNNLLNEHYFTNRATGYPGPGIIPSPVRNYYFILEYKF